jgi:hypothetical protein
MKTLYILKQAVYLQNQICEMILNEDNEVLWACSQNDKFSPNKLLK